MKITGAQVFEARGTFVSRDLYVDGGMLTDRDCGGEVLDAGGCYAIPGLTDIHFHGAVGHDFSDGDADGLAAIAEYELSRGVTHLFNAMPPFTHRAPGVMGAAFDTPDCRVELICDGIHIHPSMVRSMFKLFGADRVVLVSDTMRAAGMADGDYSLGGQPVLKKGKYATLADGTLAGSVTDLMDCMRTAVSFGIPMADAVRAAAVNPARAIGIYSRCGSLESGKWANVVLLNRDLSIRNVIFKGEIVK